MQFTASAIGWSHDSCQRKSRDDPTADAVMKTKPPLNKPLKSSDLSSLLFFSSCPKTLTPTMASSAAVPREAIERAVGALLRWHRKHPAPPSDDFIYLVLSLKTTPHNGRHLSFRIPLPRPILYSVCIFSNNNNNAQVEKAVTQNVSVSVLSTSDLKSLYPSRDGVGQLSKEFDLFLTDKKIAPKLRGLLGDVFYGKRKGKKGRSKEPVEVNLANPGWFEKAKGILGSTRLEMEGGHCKGVRVGRVSMERTDIVENVAEAVEAAVRCIPKKWNNIRSIHIKSTESVALPIYKESEGEDGDGGVDLEEHEVSKKRKVLVEESEWVELKNVKKVKR